jgi:membrane fusion protein (multidrug efflux system)
MRRAFALFFVLILFGALIGGLGYFQFVGKPKLIKDAISKMPAPVQTVSTVDSKADRWAPSVPAIGTLRAVAGVDIAPQVGGVIRSMNFDRGQDVAKGALLVQLDDSVEQADLSSNLATLKNADVTLERQKNLITGGNTAKATLDQAQATRDAAAAAAERSRALIAQKALIAPFAGRIGLRTGDIGQYIAPGFSVANLQQLDPIYVDFPQPEQNLAVLKVGARITVTVDAYPNRVFNGSIRAIDARVSSDTRNVLMRGEVPNPDKTLLPGMFANVTISAGESRDVVTIPRTGVSFSLYGDTVFAVKPEAPAAGSAQAATPPADQTMVIDRRVVKVGDAREDRVSILDGLSAGEKIVSEGQLKLQPGMRVRIDNAAALPAAPSPRSKE